MDITYFLTFFSGILVGALLPLFYRMWDRTELKSMIEIRENWKDSARSGDLDQIDTEIRNSLQSFSATRRSNTKFTKGVSIAIVCICCFVLMVVSVAKAIIALVMVVFGCL